MWKPIMAATACLHVSEWNFGVGIPMRNWKCFKGFNDTRGDLYSFLQADRPDIAGPKQPDGTYEYESHVDYWMPFNGGIGFHDAAGEVNSEASIYLTGGSHGCVNLPAEKAKILYGMIYTGIPVICHY